MKLRHERIKFLNLNPTIAMESIEKQKKQMWNIIDGITDISAKIYPIF